MVKIILFGMTLFTVNFLAIQDAKALTPVITLCPNATWARGYYIGEFIPLAENQYKVGLVSNGPSNVRSGAGFESAVLFTLDAGRQVTIIGEAWDSNCNQWMRIRIDSQLYWMHGSQLQLL